MYGVARLQARDNKHLAPLRAAGDAQGVAQGLAALRARGPGVIRPAMEVAVRLAPAGLDLEASHIWSERNRLADRLSRLSEGAVLPSALAGTAAEQPVRPRWHIFGQIAVKPPRRSRR